jgi:hypothetical protein
MPVDVARGWSMLRKVFVRVGDGREGWRMMTQVGPRWRVVSESEAE